MSEFGVVPHKLAHRNIVSMISAAQTLATTGLPTMTFTVAGTLTVEMWGEPGNGSTGTSSVSGFGAGGAAYQKAFITVLAGQQFFYLKAAGDPNYSYDNVLGLYSDYATDGPSIVGAQASGYWNTPTDPVSGGGPYDGSVLGGYFGGNGGTSNSHPAGGGGGGNATWLGNGGNGANAVNTTPGAGGLDGSGNPGGGTGGVNGAAGGAATNGGGGAGGKNGHPGGLGQQTGGPGGNSTAGYVGSMTMLFVPNAVGNVNGPNTSIYFENGGYPLSAGAQLVVILPLGFAGTGSLAVTGMGHVTNATGG